MAEHDRRALGRTLTELQVHGVVDPAVPGNPGRRGGAGPSDHRALSIEGTTVMVPVYNAVAGSSPYRLEASAGGGLQVSDAAAALAVETPPEPRFYDLTTA